MFTKGIAASLLIAGVVLATLTSSISPSTISTGPPCTNVTLTVCGYEPGEIANITVVVGGGSVSCHGTANAQGYIVGGECQWCVSWAPGTYEGTVTSRDINNQNPRPAGTVTLTVTT